MKASASQLEDIRDRLVRELQPEKIYVFGSQAWGDPTDDSDLDLLIVVPDDADSRRDLVGRAYTCLGDLRIPVDIVIVPHGKFLRRATVYASLEAQVVEEGLLLHG